MSAEIDPHVTSQYVINRRIGKGVSLYHSRRFILPHSSTYAYQNSFYSKSIRDWNNLPSNIIDLNNIDLFTSELLNIM